MKIKKTNALENAVYGNVKKRLNEFGSWRGESTRSYAQGNLSSIPEFKIDEMSEEFSESIGRLILSQINSQPLEPSTKRALQQQLAVLLKELKKDINSAAKSHLDKFFQVY